MGETVAFGFAQPDAVDHAGVVERIADDGIALIEQYLEQPPVGIETGSVEDGVFHVKKRADRPFEVLVDLMRAADKAYGRHPVPMSLEGARRRIDDAGMIGQAEVIVCTEV